MEKIKIILTGNESKLICHYNVNEGDNSGDAYFKYGNGYGSGSGDGYYYYYGNNSGDSWKI